MMCLRLVVAFTAVSIQAVLLQLVCNTHPHKRSFLHGVQQTDPQVLSFVVHRDHVEGNCFWHSQNNGQYPDQYYLNSHPLWNSNPFDTTPRGHSTIPGRANMCYLTNEHLLKEQSDIKAIMLVRFLA